MPQSARSAWAVGVKVSAKVRSFYKSDEECKQLEGDDWETKRTFGTIKRCIKKNLKYQVSWDDNTKLTCNVSFLTVVTPEINVIGRVNPTASATSETAASNGYVLLSFALSCVLYI